MSYAVELKHDELGGRYDADAEIVAIECFAATLPLRKPLVMSTYRLDSGPVLFIKVRCKGGVEGWGEAAADAVMSGETLKGMVAAIREYIAPRLIGQSAFARRKLMHEAGKRMYGNRGALAALDIALVDVVGRLRGVPAVEVLGGPMREKVSVLRLIGGHGDTAADVDEAIALREQGYHAFKLKVGVASLDTEIETALALRRALGDHAIIGVDANMGWSVAQTIRFSAAVESSDIAFIEQPCRAGDVAQMANAAAGTTVPLAIDESLHSPHDLLAHVGQRAIQGASLKTIKLGGVTPVVAIAHLCESLGLSVNFAMMMESSLATAAMVHAACAAPSVSWGLSMGSLWLAEDPAEQLAVDDGHVYCPDGPGLGVAIDEAALRRLMSA